MVFQDPDPCFLHGEYVTSGEGAKGSSVRVARDDTRRFARANPISLRNRANLSTKLGKPWPENFGNSQVVNFKLGGNCMGSSICASSFCQISEIAVCNVGAITGGSYGP